MRVLIACEFSGIVREEFAKLGCDAWSCDVLPTEIPSEKHIEGNVLDGVLDGVNGQPWDLMIAHPPCTYLCSSGAEFWKNRRSEQWQAIEFFKRLYNAPIRRICIENPVGIVSTVFKGPNQIVDPWMFGHPETKATCLWLKNLPALQATDIVKGRANRTYFEAPGPQADTKNERWKRRSRTLPGFAAAMAAQWSIFKNVDMEASV